MVIVEEGSQYPREIVPTVVAQCQQVGVQYPKIADQVVRVHHYGTSYDGQQVGQ